MPVDESRPPFPPFDEQSALVKVQAAEDAFLTEKWRRERDDALRKSLWDFHGNRRYFGPCTEAERGTVIPLE